MYMFSNITLLYTLCMTTHKTLGNKQACTNTQSDMHALY